MKDNIEQFDVVIVGNGILGYSTAYALFLEDPTLAICIIGPYHRPGGATPAAGAMLGCFGEVTSTSLASKYGREKLEMDIQAMGMWQQWLDGINEKNPEKKAVKITPGTFIIENTQSGVMEDKNYKTILTALNEYKQPYQAVDPYDIPGLNPVESCRPLNAIYLPNEGSLDTVQVLDRIHGALQANARIAFINQEVEKVVKTSDGFDVETSHGEKIVGTQVVIASGANSQKIIDQLPIKNNIPLIFAGVGLSVQIEKIPTKINSVIRTPNRAFACGLHVVPRDDSIYIGATNYLSFTPVLRPNIEDVYNLLRNTLVQINGDFDTSEIISFSTGNRPITIDTYPLIGSTSMKGLWFLTGTYRDGFHMSPLLAQHIAREMLGKKGLFNNIFQPERRPIDRFTKEEAIAETTDHYLGTYHEFGVEIPGNWWQETLNESLHRKAAAIYEALGTKYILSPEFIPFIDSDKEKHISFFKQYFDTLAQE